MKDPARAALVLRCRLKAPLVLLAFGDNQNAALPVPLGKVIEVRRLPEDDRFFLVVVDGQEFHAFATDVQEFCEPLPSLPNKRGSNDRARSASAAA